MDVMEKMENEKRLIDANALMDVIKQHEYRLATKQGSIDYGMFTLGIQQAVDEQQTIDAVPVARCRECKQGEIDDPDFPDEYYCHAGCGWNNGDFYCAYGEREEGADNG